MDNFLILFLLHSAAFWLGVHCRDVILEDTTKQTNLNNWVFHQPNPEVYSSNPSQPVGWLEESYSHYVEGRAKTWRSHTVCDVKSNAVNNWLRTPFIDVGSAERVYVEIQFSMRDCTSLPGSRSCKETFTLLYYEAEFDFASEDMPAWNYNTYKQIDRIAADEGRFSSKEDVIINKETKSIPVKSKGVYFAFHDEGACMSLLAVKIYYITCPNVTIGHAFFMETPTGPEAASVKPTTGECVGSAVQTGGGNRPTYLCTSDGSWFGHSGLCHCDAGYYSHGQTCQPCAVGQYKSAPGNTPCHRCPPYSYNSAQATRVCHCQTDYYRALSDPHTLPCTQPPSAVRNLTSALRDPNTITLTWSAPVNFGGRSDVTYRIDCVQCPNNIIYDPTQTGIHSNTTHVVITNLDSSTTYRILVYAENGVSKLHQEQTGQPGEFQEIVIKTDLAVPYNTRAIYIGNNQISISWDHATGAQLYKVKYYATNKESNISIEDVEDKNFTAKNLSENTNYIFQVSAKLINGKSGWSSYSEPLYISTGSGQDNVVVEGTESLLLIQDGQLTGIIAGATVALLVTLVIIILIVILLFKRGYHLCGGGKGLHSDCDSLEYRHPHDVSDNTEVTNPYNAGKKADPLTYNGHVLPPVVTAHGLVSASTTAATYIDPHTYEDPNQAVQDFAREIDVSFITIEAIIGGGEFGDVCKGRLRTSEITELTVAIKTLKPGSSDKARLDFLTEASIMGQFNDQNVIYLQGVVTRSNPIMIITEYMSNGSLDTFLRLNDGQLSVCQLLTMLRGISSGMKYLSHMNYIHRDLAARNILVDENLCCKVADFGLSREISFDNVDGAYTTKGGKIPVRWTAPEAIAFRKFTSSSDVWSYGVVMWEVMSFGERPYWNWSNQDVIKAIEKGYRLPPPMGCPAPVHQLMLDCWQSDRTCRPKFMHIVQTIQTLLDNQELLKINVTGRRLPKLPTSAYTHPRARSPVAATAPSPCPDAAEAAAADSTSTPVAAWLYSIKLPQYCDLFHQAGYYHVHQLRGLRPHDLRDLVGVILVGHQKKILSAAHNIAPYGPPQDHMAAAHPPASDNCYEQQQQQQQTAQPAQLRHSTSFLV